MKYVLSLTLVLSIFGTNTYGTDWRDMFRSAKTVAHNTALKNETSFKEAYNQSYAADTFVSGYKNPNHDMQRQFNYLVDMTNITFEKCIRSQQKSNECYKAYGTNLGGIIKSFVYVPNVQKQPAYRDALYNYATRFEQAIRESRKAETYGDEFRCFRLAAI